MADQTRAERRTWDTCVPDNGEGATHQSSRSALDTLQFIFYCELVISVRSVRARQRTALLRIRIENVAPSARPGRAALSRLFRFQFAFNSGYKKREMSVVKHIQLDDSSARQCPKMVAHTVH